MANLGRWALNFYLTKRAMKLMQTIESIIIDSLFWCDTLRLIRQDTQ